MIVCSCNVLSDHDVRTAVTAEARPRTTGQVYGCLGCSAQCGRCARTIRRIMDEALDGRGRPPATAAPRQPNRLKSRSFRSRNRRWMPPIACWLKPISIV